MESYSKWQNKSHLDGMEGNLVIRPNHGHRAQTVEHRTLSQILEAQCLAGKVADPTRSHSSQPSV
jgi:hypothetical protein